MATIANSQNYISDMQTDEELLKLRHEVYLAMVKYRYSYNFCWLDRPIIQLPDDIITMQEVVWKVKPDLIVETGIAHGGSLILYASMLELIGAEGEVLGVDIEIKPHNRESIEKHPMAKRITMLEGSSVDENIVRKVKDFAKDKNNILVVLDSNHTHKHVLKELKLYSPLVKKDSYLIVLDTIIEDLPEHTFINRQFGKGNNPKTALREFLKTNDRFEPDSDLEDRVFFTCAPGGYLKCIK